MNLNYLRENLIKWEEKNPFLPTFIIFLMFSVFYISNSQEISFKFIIFTFLGLFTQYFLLPFRITFNSTKTNAFNSNLDENYKHEITQKDDKHDKYVYTDTKLVLCVRTDLKMGHGKIAAQCAHAAVGIYQKCVKAKSQHYFNCWIQSGQAKICLKIKDEETLKTLSSHAKMKSLPIYTVHDAGRTQVPSGSATVLAIGPGPINTIDEVCGHLKLY